MPETKLSISIEANDKATKVFRQLTKNLKTQFDKLEKQVKGFGSKPIKVKFTFTGVGKGNTLAAQFRDAGKELQKLGGRSSKIKLSFTGVGKGTTLTQQFKNAKKELEKTSSSTAKVSGASSVGRGISSAAVLGAGVVARSGRSGSIKGGGLGNTNLTLARINESFLIGQARAISLAKGLGLSAEEASRLNKNLQPAIDKSRKLVQSSKGLRESFTTIGSGVKAAKGDTNSFFNTLTEEFNTIESKLKAFGKRFKKAFTGRGVITGVKRSFSLIKKGFSSINKLAGSFAGRLLKLLSPLRLVIAGSGALFSGFKLGERAAEIGNATAAFDQFALRVDSIGSELLPKLSKAAGGAASNLTIMASANKAIALGAVSTEDGLTELVKLGTKLGQTFGVGAAKGIEDLTTGLARQSKLVLDNLGIIVKLDEAYKSYADSVGKTTSELTDAEKKQAFINEGLKKARDLVAGNQGSSFAKSWDKLKASIANALDFLALSLAPSIEKAAKKVTEFAKAVADVQPSFENLKIVASATIELLTGLFLDAIPKFVDIGLKIGEGIAQGVARGITGVNSGTQAAFIAANASNFGVSRGVLSASVGSQGFSQLKSIGKELISLKDRLELQSIQLRGIGPPRADENNPLNQSAALRKKFRQELIDNIASIQSRRAELKARADQIVGIEKITATTDSLNNRLATFNQRISGLKRNSDVSGLTPLPQGFIGKSNKSGFGAPVTELPKETRRQLSGAAANVASEFLKEFSKGTSSLFGFGKAPKSPAAKPQFQGSGGLNDPFGVGPAINSVFTAIKQGAISTKDFYNNTFNTFLGGMSDQFAEIEARFNDSRQVGKDVVNDINTGIKTGFDSLFQSIIDGTFSIEDAWKNLTNAILRNLLDTTSGVVSDGITSLLKSGVGALFGSDTTPATANAKGNVFNNGSIVPFANGGIVNKPTVFPMSGGRTGLMGEAGTEGIFPVKRMRNGKLGVQADVNSAESSPVIVNFNVNSLDPKTAASVIIENRKSIEGVIMNAISTKPKFKRALGK